MIALIRAELRKNWKTKKFLVAILCFVIYMACSYIFCLQKDQAYYHEQTQNLIYENTVTGSISGTLLMQLQNTPYDEEPEGLRESFNLWKTAHDEVYRWTMLRQADEYYGFDLVGDAAYLRSKAMIAVRTSDLYKKELEGSGQSIRDVQDDLDYFTYLKKHKMPMYRTPYEPNLLNFIVQLFQNETIILLIMVSAFFIIDQICQDFECGSYKNIYALPWKRSTIMSAKVISSLVMITIAFFVALILFSWVPLMQYGVGSIQYPYVFDHMLITYLPLLGKMIPFVLLIMLFYMTVCVIAANVFKNTTNTLLFMTGILLVVYLGVQFFGLHNPWITWLPFFYIYPFDVVFEGYDYAYLVCMVISLVAVALMYLFFWRKMEKVDFKGSDAS